MPNYCNITTDLQDVYQSHHDFAMRQEVENWSGTSGQAATYEKAFTGYVGNCFENGN